MLPSTFSGPVLLSFAALLIFSTSGCGSGSTAPSNPPTTNPVPAITSLTPSSVSAGGSPVTVKVSGSGFVSASTVLWNGTPLATTYSSASELSASLSASNLANGTTAQVTVSNPGPGGGTSAAAQFLVNNPQPALASISPASALVGSGSLSIDLTGSGFVPSSVVTWNGAPRVTTFVSGTEVRAALPAADDSVGAIASVAVSNPIPAGGTSGTISFSVNNPTPSILSVTPASVEAGSPTTVLTISGTGFVTSSVLSLNGNALATKFVNSTQVIATLSTEDIASGQIAQLSVSNPVPGGGDSAKIPFNITSPTPRLISISPIQIPKGVAAAIDLSGSGFEADSVVTWNGSPRLTTFNSSTSLRVMLTVTDTQTTGVGQLAVMNPGPGGTTSSPIPLPIVSAIPVIASVTPSSALVGAGGNSPLPIIIAGSQFAANATLTVNGQAVAIASQSSTSITTSIPTSYLAKAASLALVVTNPATVPAQSEPYVFNVVAVPAIDTISPSSAPIGSPDQTLQVNGGGLLADSIVNWNGIPLATKSVTSNWGGVTLTATLPATYLSLPTIGTITVSSPENAAAVSQPQAFPTYLPLPTNVIVYNPKDGLLYASVPGFVGAGLGNSVVAINPANGLIAKTIPVGSEPNKLSISDDGTQLYVGLDGAAAVRQVDLTTGAALQFSLGEYDLGQTYSYPITAANVAALPGKPNSVAVLQSNADVIVFDSGVARQNPAVLNGYFNQNVGSLSFGQSAANLYVSTFSSGTSSLSALTLGSTGFTGITSLQLPYFAFSSIQYDSGNLYLNNGAVLKPTTGALVGQFYTSGTDLAAGPIVSDSTLNRAWILPQNPVTTADTNQILAFDETTFKRVGAIVLIGASTSGQSFGAVDLVRWGQNGLAFNNSNQIYMLQSSVVKDISQSPADLSVAIQASKTASTGGTLTYSVAVTNVGPGAATGVSLSTTLSDDIAYKSTTASVGSCAGTSQVICSLGNLHSGATATVQVVGTVLDPGSIESTALVSSITYDPVQSNNIATATTIVSGASYAAVPAMASVSPRLILAGSSTTTLTVKGNGFTDLSTVSWNGNSLPTTYVSNTELAASLAPSYIAKLGWGRVAVSTPAPGGGQSSSMVVSVYQSVNIPVAGVLYEPFTRKLYVTVPDGATNIAANSLVQLDPLTGTISTPIVLGNGPNVMAESADGKYLYVGLSAAKKLGQFDLSSQSMTATYTLNVPGTGLLPAGGLAVQPGTNETLAVNTNYNGIGIFDISGSSGAFRPNFGGFGSIAFADANNLYSESSNTADQYLGRYTIDANGLKLMDSTGLNGLGGTGFSIALGQDGLVYGDNGGIINPIKNPPSQVAVLPLTPGEQGYGLSGDAVVPDSAQHKAFLVGVNTAGSFTSYLERFDTTNYINEENYFLPIPSGSAEEGYQLLRWGQDGLAVRSYDPIYGNLANAQLLLFKGPFVLPSETQSNPIPGLTSVSPSTVARNSGNQYLTVAGSGFMPGAVILWNGVARTTTFIDATHLQFAVAAADVAAPQTVSLTAENPGSTASTGLTLTVN